METDLHAGAEMYGANRFTGIDQRSWIQNLKLRHLYDGVLVELCA